MAWKVRTLLRFLAMMAGATLFIAAVGTAIVLALGIVTVEALFSGLKD